MKILLLIFLSFCCLPVIADCKLNTINFDEEANNGFICTNFRDLFLYQDIANSFCKNYLSYMDDMVTEPGGYSFSCMKAMFQVQNPQKNITKAIPDFRKPSESEEKYIAPKTQVKIKADTEKEKLEKINSAKIKCSELGYIKGSDRFNKCVLELFQ
jgi:hypothetical protein